MAGAIRSARGARVRALVLHAALAFGLASAPGVVAQAADCAAASQSCGDLMDFQCLKAFGVGSVAATATVDCDTQRTAYRRCLEQLVQSCDHGLEPVSKPQSQPGSGASGGWGGKSAAADETCVLGRWSGWVVEPGFSSYTIELDVGVSDGAVFARSWYPELACGGGGPAIEGSEPGRLLMAETITKNRNNCADGRFSLTCLGEDRLLWRWYRNTGESFDAVLTRR